MRDLGNEYQVIEMLHVIKIFIGAAKRLTSEGIDALEKIADLMKKSKPREPYEMTISEVGETLGHPTRIVKEHSNRKM